jgi:hypothetical protein
VTAINKTMDRADLDDPRAREVCAALNALVRELDERGLWASNWYGALRMSGDAAKFERANRGQGYEPLPDAADDARFPWFLYWEIAWLSMHNDFRPGERLLDLGGSSSLFSYWAASQGLEVVTIDLQDELVANADAVAAATGWSLRNLAMDIRSVHHDESFDHITSVCVFEHIPVTDRVAITARLRDLLVDGGTLSLTFDYVNPSPVARIDSPQDVEAQFVAPSGLRVRGNAEFADNGLRYLRHPDLSQDDDYTFGALFLER